MSVTAPPSTDTLAITSFPIQVGHDNEKVMTKMKWESSERVLNDHIPLVNYDVGDQFWLLERDEKEFLWSFHVMVRDTKLYVTYNDDKTNDQNITMQDIADGDVTREREYFTRILDENLRGYEWISSPAVVGDKIKVGLNPLCNRWHVEHTGDVYTIHDHNYTCFASAPTADDGDDVLFEANVSSPSNLREFKTIVTNKSHGTGHLIQNVATKRYVGSVGGENGDLLKLKEEESQATMWRFVTTHMFLMGNNGDRVVFPPPSTQERGNE